MREFMLLLYVINILLFGWGKCFEKNEVLKIEFMLTAIFLMLTIVVLKLL